MGKRKSITVFLVLFIVVLSSNFSVFASGKGEEHYRLSLKDLKGVFVFVYFSSEEIRALKKVGLSEEIIQTDVELKLRMAGINVVSKKEDLPSIPGLPLLVVEIIGHGIGRYGNVGAGIAFNIDVELLQKTYLARDPNLILLAGTWEIGVVGFSYADKGAVVQIRNAVKDCVDRFINDYLSVNPKGGGTKMDKKPRLGSDPLGWMRNTRKEAEEPEESKQVLQMRSI